MVKPLKRLNVALVKNHNKTRPDPRADGEGHSPARRRVDQVHALARLRRRIAEQTRFLAERELEARLLRLDIAMELRRTGSTKTDAETSAKAHPRYIAHERATLELSFARALSEAEAEVVAFELKGALDESMVTATAQLAAATLLAPWWAHASRPAQQALVCEALRLIELLRVAEPDRPASLADAAADPPGAG